VRRLERTWWIWGAIVSILFLMFTALISPVYIDPLFNKYTRLEDKGITRPIVAMARANGIPVTDVWEVNASKQSNRVSANVSGFLGTDASPQRQPHQALHRRLPRPWAKWATSCTSSWRHPVLRSQRFFSFGSCAGRCAVARAGGNWDIRGIGDTSVRHFVLQVLLLC
jgi:hypothetical protein